MEEQFDNSRKRPMEEQASSNSKKRRMTAAERQQKSRKDKLAEMSEEEKSAYRKRESAKQKERRKRQLGNMSEEVLALYKQNDSDRHKSRKHSSLSRTPDIVALPFRDAYRSVQSLGKAVKRSMESLPCSPRKKRAVVARLAERMDIQMDEEKVPAAPANDNFDDVIEFFLRSDISYTSPGMADMMTHWDSDGKKTKLRKYYLTMWLREAHALFVDSIRNISFSKFCKLRPVNVLLIGDTPTEQCKCITHENFFLKLEALGIVYDEEWWTTVLCDAEQDSQCWQGLCSECSKPNLDITEIELQKFVTYRQWVETVIEKEEEDEKSEKEEGSKKKERKEVRILSQKVVRGKVLEELQKDWSRIVAHVNVKRIQERAFIADKSDPTKRVLQIDYAMAYQCEYQNEVQKALWTRGSINLMTAAVTQDGETKTAIVCTNEKHKDKYTTGLFIEHLYDDWIDEDADVEEIIWSDGPSSEFKNRYMKKLLERLSKKYKKPFTWKFSATSHGKGVVDGVDGNIKSLVRRKTMSKGRDRIIVQDSASFAVTAQKLASKTFVFHFTTAEIQKYKSEDHFFQAQEVSGISKCHAMQVSGESWKIWRTELQHKEDPLVTPADVPSTSGTAQPRQSFTSIVSVQNNGLENDGDTVMEKAKDILLSAWASVHVSNTERSMQGNWYGVIYSPGGKKKDMLFIAKAEKRFLQDSHGPVKSILLKCLRQKIGSGNILDELPCHLAEDIYDCPLENIIAGPLSVVYQGNGKFLVPDYEKVLAHFHLVVKEDRGQWM